MDYWFTSVKSQRAFWLWACGAPGSGTWKRRTCLETAREWERLCPGLRLLWQFSTVLCVAVPPGV